MSYASDELLTGLKHTKLDVGWNDETSRTWNEDGQWTFSAAVFDLDRRDFVCV